MIKECKQEILDYLLSEGYDHKIFCVISLGSIVSNGIYGTLKCQKRGIDKKWVNEPEKYNKYFLEFIGHILRKYNVTKICVFDVNNHNYKSHNWNFNNIIKIDD